MSEYALLGKQRDFLLVPELCIKAALFCPFVFSCAEPTTPTAEATTLLEGRIVFWNRTKRSTTFLLPRLNAM